MSNILLYHNDCLQEMKNISDKSIDMILCDLPYGTTACKWDVIIPFEPLWKEYKRIIKDRGCIALFGSEPFSSYLRMSNIKNYKYDWIWNKNKGSNIMLAKKQPLKIHENIIVFNCSNYFPQKTSVIGKIRDQRKEKEKINRIDGAVTPKGPIKYSTDYDPSKKYPVSIQYFSNHREKEYVLHPTQKPVALLEYLIKTYTLENETVLDNCMGSGSTGVACVNTNRNFIGIEKDEIYFGVAQKRIEDTLKAEKRRLF